MRDQGQLLLAVVIILIGVVFLIGNLLDVEVWALCWPAALIFTGLLVLFRPQWIGSNAAVRHKLIGDIRRSGSWDVTDEEFWIGVGDVKLDLTAARIPMGQVQIRVRSFVSPVRLLLPAGVGVLVSSTAFITDAKVFGQRRETILTPFNMASDDYETAERKIRLEITSFVGDIRIERASEG